ncbi:DedA family protein [Francisellaceae bacterium CB300]|jgi:membrane protein DedA with SNARE-associated domain
MGEQEFWHLMIDWGYLAVALAVLIEGEIFLIMVGIATATTLFSYPLVIIAATIGAIVHDNGIFIFSKIAGKKFIEKRPHWQKKIDRSLRLIDKYDFWAILSIRFLYGLRTITIFIVGLGNVSKIKFVTLDAISSLIWSFIYITLGYFSGHAILHFINHVDIAKWISRNKYLSIFILILLSSIIYLSYKILYKISKRQTDE